jgi:RNA polymerase sigma-70 factor, ECF subfamily
MTANALQEFPVQSPAQPDSTSDQQLIAAIKAGDPAAFEVLYFRHRDWVVNLACRFTGSEDLALDVMQETFLYFLKKFPGFRLTANLKTFLYPAVKNFSIAARRKAGRYQSTEAEQQVLEQTATEAPQPCRSSELVAALANLSGEHREVLLLRFVDDLSLAEIAEATAIPLGTVKSRLHNALGLLRQDKRAKEFSSNELFSRFAHLTNDDEQRRSKHTPRWRGAENPSEIGGRLQGTTVVACVCATGN